MKRKFILPFVALALTQAACLKQPDFEELSSDFIVSTNIDPTVSFSGYQTYFISDSVAYLNSSLNDTILKNESTQKLVDAVKQNMNARGFTFVPKSASPDLGMNMGIMKDVDVGYIYSGWWWGYPGWWDPWYWGWYYPYYYPWVSYYVVKTGTVVVDMMDLKNAQKDQRLKIVWNALASGAVGDNLSGNIQRGVDAINQAFTQSPALKRN
jgi:hypothetical protein